MESESQQQRNIFSKNLKYWCERKNITQADIVEKFDLSASTVSDWFNGKKFPRIDKIQMLADYLGILKSDLIEEKSPESLEDHAYFRVMQTAKEKGYTPEDLKLAMEFLARARKRDNKDEN